MDEFLVPNVSYLRLLAEYKKHGTLCIGYDFDGTVHDFHKEGHTYNQVVILLRQLAALGCRLICWTAYKEHEYVANYLEKNDIPCDGINTNGVYLGWDTRKPFFNALLDDRAGLIQVYSDLDLLVKTIKAND